MNTGCRYILIIFLLLLFSFGLCYAEARYVTDITKITMRSAPDGEHKIISMLQSGTRVDVIEKTGAWSKVKTKDGKEGWALSRFLVDKKPAVILLSSYERQNKKLNEELGILKNENKTLNENNQRLLEIEKQYVELKKNSKDFLKLKQEHEVVLKKFAEQQETIDAFEDNYKNRIMIWFLIGAGVFVFGVLLGIGAKKNRRSYLR